MSGDSQALFKLLRVITEKIEMGIRRSDGLSFIYPINYRSGDSTCDYFIYICCVESTRIPSHVLVM